RRSARFTHPTSKNICSKVLADQSATEIQVALPRTSTPMSRCCLLMLRVRSFARAARDVAGFSLSCAVQADSTQSIKRLLPLRRAESNITTTYLMQPCKRTIHNGLVGVVAALASNLLVLVAIRFYYLSSCEFRTG